MSDEHYDGDLPLEPLPADHLTTQQQNEARELGDGSPGIDPRTDENTTESDRSERTRQSQKESGDT